MRIVLSFVAMSLLLVESGTTSSTVAGLSLPNYVSAASAPRIDFESELKPIFKSKCMPCHFEGGKMYESLPFDRPETIRKLGDRLLTRIKEENDRRMIKEFLKQSP
jgi:hypothetical protein